MPLLMLTLCLGAAMGGLLAALPALKHTCRNAQKGSRSDTALAAAQHQEAASEEDWSAQDEHLIRELRDDVELRLRRVRRMAPGEQRRCVCACVCLLVHTVWHSRVVAGRVRSVTAVWCAVQPVGAAGAAKGRGCSTTTEREGGWGGPSPCSPSLFPAREAPQA